MVYGFIIQQQVRMFWFLFSGSSIPRTVVSLPFTFSLDYILYCFRPTLNSCGDVWLKFLKISVLLKGVALAMWTVWHRVVLQLHRIQDPSLPFSFSWQLIPFMFLETSSVAWNLCSCQALARLHTQTEICLCPHLDLLIFTEYICALYCTGLVPQV